MLKVQHKRSKQIHKIEEGEIPEFFSIRDASDFTIYDESAHMTHLLSGSRPTFVLCGCYGSLEEKIEELTNYRNSLLRRIKPRTAGVVALRQQLAIVTHSLMFEENVKRACLGDCA